MVSNNLTWKLVKPSRHSFFTKCLQKNKKKKKNNNNNNANNFKTAILAVKFFLYVQYYVCQILLRSTEIFFQGQFFLW